MNYAADMGSAAVIYHIPSFRKICSGIQSFFFWGGGGEHRKQK
jgi:hypothetical protein